MKMPTDAVVAITYKCNSKCIMCDIWQKPNFEELEYQMYAKLPNSLRTINISGGEPFLRKDLPEIISVLSTTCNKSRLGISTNGLLTNRIKECMETISSRKIKHVSVNVSIHGIGKVHDKVMNINGAFDRAINTVQTLKDMGLKDLGIAYTYTNDNAGQLSNVIELAQKLDIQYTFCGLAHSSELMFKLNKDPITDLKELNYELDSLVKNHLKSFYPRNWFRAYIESGNYYYANTGKRKIPCGAGVDWFYMEPNGAVYPDNVLSFNFGSIKNQSFNEVWRSDKAKEFRDKINIYNCPNPCWMLCTVYPYMRRDKLNCIKWILKNKLKVHTGLEVNPIQ